MGWWSWLVQSSYVRGDGRGWSGGGGRVVVVVRLVWEGGRMDEWGGVHGSQLVL